MKQQSATSKLLPYEKVTTLLPRAGRYRIGLGANSAPELLQRRNGQQYQLQSNAAWQTGVRPAPARTGLGTSSTFAVGMLNAFYALKGKYADKKKLADEAIYLERVLCNEAGGWQDQIAASFGGFNRINFNADGYEVLPIIISPERKKQLNNNLMMFFTGFTRFSSEVQKANAASSPIDKSVYLKQMYDLVDDAEMVLVDKTRDLDDFGRLLDKTWKLKRQTGGSVSTNSIDGLYARGIEAGALGGKLLGAGGGGFLVFYVQPEKQEAVRTAMSDLMYIPFEFENGGTRVIHYTPEAYEPK